MEFSISDVVAVGSAAGSAACIYVALSTRAAMLELAVEIANLKTSIATQRIQDWQEMRSWINGSFMRAGETHARLTAIEEKIDNHLTRGR